jgi:hypothetical protein
MSLEQTNMLLIPTFLSTYLPSFLPIYLSIYLFIYLSVCLSVCLSTHLFIHPCIYLPVYVCGIVQCGPVSPVILISISRLWAFVRARSMRDGRVTRALSTQDNTNTRDSGMQAPIVTYLVIFILIAPMFLTVITGV